MEYKYSHQEDLLIGHKKFSDGNRLEAEEISSFSVTPRDNSCNSLTFCKAIWRVIKSPAGGLKR
jgi:hypothetical protein